MNRFLLLLGTSTLTAALFIISKSQKQAPAAGGFGSSLARWGRRERLSAAGTMLKGGLEHGLGEMTSNSLVSGKGLLDEATAVAKHAAGKLAEAIVEPHGSH